MSRTAIILSILFAFGSLGLFCPGPAGGPPDPDSCSNAEVGALTALEVGRPEDGAFMAFGDDATADLIVGGQGSSMMALRLRGRGAVPECLDQSTKVESRGSVIGTSSVAVKTYAEADGSRTTKILYVVLVGSDPRPGDSVQVTSTVGSQTITRTLWIDFMVDAGIPDAAPADVSIPDAQAPDARD